MRSLQLILAVASMLLAPLAFGGDFEKGLNAYKSGDYQTAFTAWQPLAEAGDPSGQFGLGQMYGNGFGVDMDDALAIKWYGSAAEQGHAQAQCNLAVMYQNGWGVPQSDVDAVKFYKLAGEQGLIEAMQALGRYYAMDFSDDYDPVQAYKWYGLASLLGDVNAGSDRDVLAEKLTVEQITEARGLIEIWSNSNAELIAKQ